MTEVTIRRYVPPFKIDRAGVRVVDGDYNQSDLGDILGTPRVHDAAVGLRRLTPDLPALAYVVDPGSGRALAVHFRLAGFRAEHLDDGQDVGVIRSKVGELVSRRLDVLVSCRRLAGTQPIPGLHMVMLVTPTMSPAKHQRYLGRLDPSTGELVIIDLVDNCGRHGLPAGWVETVTVGPSAEIIRDPMISRITEAPFKDVLRWAKGNPARLEMVAKAKGFKDGWVFHAIESFDPIAAEQWWNSRTSRGGQRPRRRDREAATSRLDQAAERPT
jgi:hypothetical protein